MNCRVQEPRHALAVASRTPAINVGGPRKPHAASVPMVSGPSVFANTQASHAQTDRLRRITHSHDSGCHKVLVALTASRKLIGSRQQKQGFASAKHAALQTQMTGFEIPPLARLSNV
jgi:hypothetical protein